MRFAFLGSRAWFDASRLEDPEFWLDRLQMPPQQTPWVPADVDDHWQLLDIRPSRRFAYVHGGLAMSGMLRAYEHEAVPVSDTQGLVDLLGECWLQGSALDWLKYSAHEHRRRVPLPTYPFERQRFWIDPSPAHAASPAVEAFTASPVECALEDGGTESGAQEGQRALARLLPGIRSDVERLAAEMELDTTLRGIWEELLGCPVAPDENVFRIGANSLMVVQVITRLRRMFPLELTVRAVFEAPTPRDQALVVASNLVEVMQQMSDDEMEKVLAS
jgi:acyl transferase domain-containing protein